MPAPAACARSASRLCACAALACVAVPCARCVRAQQSSDGAGPTSIVHAPTRLRNLRQILARCANAMCGHAVRDRALLASARHDRALSAHNTTKLLCMFALCALVFCMCAEHCVRLQSACWGSVLVQGLAHVQPVVAFVHLAAVVHIASPVCVDTLRRSSATSPTPPGTCRAECVAPACLLFITAVSRTCIFVSLSKHYLRACRHVDSGPRA